MTSPLILPKRALVHFTTPSMAVGGTYTVYAHPRRVLTPDLVRFESLILLQAFIAVRGVTTFGVTQQLRLELFSSREKRLPEDLIARIEGPSDLSDIWFLSKKELNVEYFDMNGTDYVHGVLTNLSTNASSLPSAEVMLLFSTLNL